MMTGAIQAANQAEKEQIILMKKIHKIVLKSNRKRMQNEEKEMAKQTKLNAGAVNNGDCMDVNLALDTNWGIHGHGINTTEEPCKGNKGKEKEKVYLLLHNSSEHF